MLCVAVTYIIKDDQADEVAEKFRQMIEPTRAEPGNLMYLAHRSPTEPNRFFLYEQYTGQAALDFHRASPHFQQFVAGGIFPHVVSREPVMYQLLD